MALMFPCPDCRDPVIIKFLRVGEQAKCKSCGALCSVPSGAVPWPVVRWDERQTHRPLTISPDGLTLSWRNQVEAAWLCSQMTARLSKGVFRWDFVIEAIVGRQIAVGFLVDPPDWGFFGYLGAGANAWAYDAFLGAIVTRTKAIHSGLPTIRTSGTVAVHLDLARYHRGVFVVNGVETPAIDLPANATVIPAASLLEQGQIVTFANLTGLESAGHSRA